MQNLLYNSDFETGFCLWRGSSDLNVAMGWTPWWMEQTGDDPAWRNRRPEFKPATLNLDSSRIRKGVSAQQYSTFWGTHVAGLWQQVVVKPGALYRFSVWGHAWSSEGDAAQPSNNPTNVHMSVGIDPLGGGDPQGRSVIWSEDQNAIDDWRHFRVEARAESDVITVFIRSAPEWPKKHQVVFWDESSLDLLEDGAEDGPDSGDDGRTRIRVSPAAPSPGKAAKVAVLSRLRHQYASLVVRGPAGEVLPVTEATERRRGDDHMWEYAFHPMMSGPHMVIFGTDSGSRVISWKRVPVGGEIPEEEADLEYSTEPEDSQSPEITSNHRGAPRVQYRRTYVLLPPTADSVWAEAAMRGSVDTQRTVGFSADDAGIGDLDDRRVIAVNPHHWRNELTADWFEEHYPGIRFYSLVADSPDELASILRNWRD